MEVRVSNSAEAHVKWFDELIEPGDGKLESSPRGMMTREIIGATSVFHAPNEHVPFVFGRKLNYFGMLMESMWILSRMENLNVLSVWNEALGNYADRGIDFSVMYGAYGPRLFSSGTAENGMSQIEAAINCIHDDPDSRRGVATIYQPRDAGHQTKDLPCNTQVMFKLRDRSLHMTVINRSNDVHLGLFGVNAPQFFFLGNYVARALEGYGEGEVYLEEQRHYSDSLHIYLNTAPQADITERMMKFKGNGFPRTFRFYDYYRPPLSPSIIPSIIRPTRLDYVGEGLLRLSSNAVGPSHNVPWKTQSSYEATVWALLHFYADFKMKNMDRDKALITLNEYLDSWLEISDADDDSGPAVDWIAGAYYSLVAWGGWNKRSERTDVAVAMFDDFIKKHTGNHYRSLSSLSFQNDYCQFLLEG